MQQRLKKFTNKMEIVEQGTKYMQTDVSFKNEAFTATID